MREETLNWWKQSLADLNGAEKNYKIQEYSFVVFLCQQAVEKGLKAYFLQQKKTGSGKTHSLVYLAAETKVPQRFFNFLRKLTPQFVNTRYPDAAYGIPSELYDKELAKEFLQETEEFMQWLKSKIKM